MRLDSQNPSLKRINKAVHRGSIIATQSLAHRQVACPWLKISKVKTGANDKPVEPVTIDQVTIEDYWSAMIFRVYSGENQ